MDFSSSQNGEIMNYSYSWDRDVRVARGGMLPVNWLLFRNLNKKRWKIRSVISPNKMGK